MGTIHTPLSVAKSFCESNNLTIVTTSIPTLSPNYIIVWLEENASNYDKIIVLAVSPTQFLLWAYGDNAELLSTSFDYAEINAPPTAEENPY